VRTRPSPASSTSISPCAAPPTRWRWTLHSTAATTCIRTTPATLRWRTPWIWAC
jgi:hypothetical protein